MENLNIDLVEIKEQTKKRGRPRVKKPSFANKIQFRKAIKFLKSIIVQIK